MEQNSTLHEASKDEHLDCIGSTLNSRTYKRKTCKDIYITLAYKEEDPKKIDYVRIVASSKENNCAVSFLEIMADLLTFAIRRIRNEHEAAAIIKNLRHQKCLNCPISSEHNSSCGDAVAQVLEREFEIPK